MTRSDLQGARNDELFSTPSLSLKIKFWRYQWIGAPFLLVIPLLALFGVFGHEDTTHSFSTNDLRGEVKFPTKLRLGRDDKIKIDLENISGRKLENLKVKFSPDYLGKFSNINFIPQSTKSFEVLIPSLESGEKTDLMVSIQADDYWNHEGKIFIFQGEREVRTVELNTFVFP